MSITTFPRNGHSATELYQLVAESWSYRVLTGGGSLRSNLVPGRSPIASRVFNRSNRLQPCRRPINAVVSSCETRRLPFIVKKLYLAFGRDRRPKRRLAKGRRTALEGRWRAVIGSRSHCGRGDNGAAGPAVFPANGIDRSVEGASSASLSTPAKCSSNSARRLAWPSRRARLLLPIWHVLTTLHRRRSHFPPLPPSPARLIGHTTAAASASAYRKHPVIQLSSVGRKWASKCGRLKGQPSGEDGQTEALQRRGQAGPAARLSPLPTAWSLIYRRNGYLYYYTRRRSGSAICCCDREITAIRPATSTGGRAAAHRRCKDDVDVGQAGRALRPRSQTCAALSSPDNLLVTFALFSL